MLLDICITSMIDLSRYLNQDIYYNERSGYDKYGKPETTLQSIRARVVYTNRQTRGLQAKPLDWDIEVWVYPTIEFVVDDTLTVDGLDFRIMEVQTLRDRLGNVHHRKLLCQKYVG